MKIESELIKYNQEAKNKKIAKEYIKEYLELKENDLEKIILLKTKDLPKHYQAQLEIFQDEKLNDVIVSIMPDELWVKGEQPSESIAEKQLILIKKSYFEKKENPDEIAWLCHELAHCQYFLNSKSPEKYKEDITNFAFKDLKTKYNYPNNLVEQFAFTTQFRFLKKQGKSKEDILLMIKKYYQKDDFSFFNRLLDRF